MESRAMNLTYPLIDYLLSSHTNNNMVGVQRNDLSDLDWMKLALTRFMDAPDDTHLFERDNIKLLAVLERCVSGQFSNVTGTSWNVGEPMHLSHLVGALLRKISEMDNHYVQENKKNLNPGRYIWPIRNEFEWSGERSV